MIRRRARQLGEVLGRWFRDPIGCWAEFVERRTRDRQKRWLQELNRRLALTPPPPRSPPAEASPTSPDNQQEQSDNSLHHLDNVLPGVLQQSINRLKRLAGRIAQGASLLQVTGQVRETLRVHAATILRRVLHSASNDRANEAASSALCEVAGQAASNTINNAATAAGVDIIVAGGSAIISATTLDCSQVNSTSTALGGEIECETSILSLISGTVNANRAIGATAPDGEISTIDGSVILTNSFANANKAIGTIEGAGSGIHSDESVFAF